MSEAPGGLRRAAAQGARWTGASAAVRGGLGLVQVAILARLLDKADFGLAATTTVVIGFISLYSDLGLNNALIARRIRDRRVLSSLYWANVGAAVVLCVLLAAAAPLVALTFGEPALTGLVAVASTGFILGAVGQQFQILLQRELRFEVIAKAEVAAQLISLVAAVTAAALGAGAYAIVIGLLAGAGSKSVMMATLGAHFGRPGRHASLADIREHIGFGAYQLGERTLSYAAANVDYVLIGLFLGPEALGVYFLAYQLVVKPLLLINPPLTRVAFPVFAQRGTDDAALRTGFLEVTRLVCFAVGPILALLAVAAGHFVPVVFGERYDDVVILVQLLALIGLTKALSTPLSPVLLARQRVDLGFRIQAVNLVTLTVALAIAVQFGIVAVAAAYVGVGIAINVAWPFILRALLDLAPLDYLRSLWPPLRLMAVAAVVAGLALVLLGGQDAEPHAPRLLAVVTAGGLAGLGALLLFDRAYVREVLGLLRGRGG